MPLADNPQSVGSAASRPPFAESHSSGQCFDDPSSRPIVSMIVISLPAGPKASRLRPYDVRPAIERF